MIMPELPPRYTWLENKCAETGFTMPSDRLIGSLLKTLIASRPDSNLLELGTGMSLSLAWMISGMDKYSRITSIDNYPMLIDIAKSCFGKDKRVTLLCTDGGDWIQNYSGGLFDLIFADTWPGKYSHLEETLALVKPGGFYVVDDMNPRDDWPEVHHAKAKKLTDYLRTRDDFTFTELNWSTGIILCTRVT